MLPTTYLHFTSLSSTNTWAKDHALDLDPKHLTCITSNIQTAGRGRDGRLWISPEGNLYLSLFFTIPAHNSYLLNLGQLLSLICAEQFSLSIKWPNDLVTDYKKVGGVLTETISLGSRIGVIIGLGLNVHVCPQLDREVTSLQLLTGKTFDLQNLAQMITASFAAELPLLQKEGFSLFHKRFENHLAYKGEKITFHEGSKKLEGLCEGITEDGRLKFRDLSNNIATLISGEIA